ncbi:MAG: hypothetical protein CMB13_06940 [Euryarchaeota archaeon]|nr:hypothetical protein [Euryarchaeota archaeon]
MRALCATFVILLLLLSSSPTSLASPIEDLSQNSPSFDPLDELLQTIENSTAPRVMVIGIDGVRSDVAQISASRDESGLARMASEGAWTYDSNVGPISISGPSWSSMLTGVWCDRHGVMGNGFDNHKLDQHLDLIDRVERYDSSLKTASLVYWEPISNLIIGPGIADIQERYDEDAQVHERAVEILREDIDLDLFFVAYDDPDYAGHVHGFSPDVPEYVDAVKLADDRFAELLDVLDERISRGEDWLVIVTSDHGGGGSTLRGHSASSSVVDLTTFMMVRGGETVAGEIYGSVVVDVAVTALTHLEVPLPNGEAALDGRPLAFQPDLESARVPDCSAPIVEVTFSYIVPIVQGTLVLIIAVASFIFFKRRKSTTIDEEE